MARTWKSLKSTAASYDLKQHHTHYLEAANPVYAWRAYRAARAAGVRVPEWVLAYLDDCAAVLDAPNGPTSPKGLADALGYGTKGGPSRTRQGRTADFQRAVADEVDMRRAAWRRQGNRNVHERRSDADVFDAVAEAHGLSPDRVQDVYYRLYPQDKRRKD